MATCAMVGDSGGAAKAGLRSLMMGSTFAAMLALAGCSASDESAATRTVWVADGPPITCIATQQIRTIRVINDQTIDFEMTGGRVFRNELPLRCSGLSFNTRIRHNSRSSQLCSLNMVTVDSFGAGRSATSCQLGRFQPMRRAPEPIVPPAP
jgi:hypothetical protein